MREVGQNGMMRSARRVGGVALLAVRASLRTKVVAALLALLAVCVAGLPGAIKGDGTPEGALQILLSYTLGFAFGLLCLATMWSACALFAAEIDSERMQLSAVKPVSALEFWGGKWLALLALNAVLLAAVYAGVYGQVRWRMARGAWDELERPVSRRVARPVLPTPQEEAREMYASLKAQGALPEGKSERAVLRVLEEKAHERYDVVNPDEEMRWRFRLARPVGAGQAVTARIRFDTEFSTREHVTGVCRLRCLDVPGSAAVEVAMDDFTRSEIEFAVDTRAFGLGGGKGPEAAREFELTFRHTGDLRRAAGLMLRSRQDVALLTPGGSFEANMARAALVHWGVLALLAAFGLALSACFSLPVAAFVATALLVLTMVGNSVVQVVSEEDERELKNRVGIWVSRGVHEVSARAMEAEPLVSLTRGERIEDRLLAASVMWNGVLVPLFFAAAGSWVLRRRELADAD